MISSSLEYKNNILSSARQINSRITVTMNVLDNGTPNVFGDERVISANIVEETSVLNLTAPSNELSLVLDNTDKKFNFLTLGNMHTIIASRPTIKVEFGLVIDDTTTEWIPMGLFYIDSWKNDVGSMTITFTAHDFLMVLENTSFQSTAINNVYDLAESILVNASCTNYVIDPSLKNYEGYGKLTWTTNSRELLQHIGLVTGTTLLQDRHGVVKLAKYQSITEASRYIIHTTTQNALYGYVSPSTVQIVDNEGGMRSVYMKDMYEIPSVELDKSIYQMNVAIYEKDSTEESIQTLTYTNENIVGNYGDSFSLDIPLVTSSEIATEIASRVFTETMYNAVYSVRWRQNPVIESSDFIMMDDSENSMKNTRITKQEFKYQGYLSGITESRGGV